MRGLVVFGLGILVALLFVPVATADVAYFADPYDTIQVPGGTTLSTAATIEARIYFSSSLNRTGFIFCEWADGQEDKALSGGPGGLVGRFFDADTIGAYAYPTITMDVWHHVATVLDGAWVRVYLDGVQVATDAAAGDINNNAAAAFIGAINRDYANQQGFGGYLDWLRVSDVARYPGGTSFTPPSSQPASDANTQLLFYFDEAPGSTTAADQSGHSNGTLGTGFTGATSPQFTSAPLEVVPSVPALGLVGVAALGVVLAGLGAFVLALRRA